MKVLSLLFGLVLLGASPVLAAELRISKQYGVNYLPMTVLEHNRTIETKAAEAGIPDLKVRWVTLGGGAASNDALLSGGVDLICLGVPPFIRLWDKTNGRARALSAFSRFPQMLNTNNPAVHSVRDFTDKDRIALPAVKVSIQSLILQMAAAQAFGPDQFDRLDKLTVAAKHPDAYVALISGKSEITGHFAQEPFHFQEVRHPNIHTVVDAYDVLGGPFTSNVIVGTDRFYTENRTLADIVARSIEEAIDWIDANPEEAARLYIETAKSTESVADMVAILRNPRGGFSATPLKMTVFSDFLHQTGAIRTQPADWTDLFFPVAHDKDGS